MAIPLLASSTPLQSALKACKQHFMMAAVFSGLLNFLYLAPSIYMLQVYDRAVPTRGVATLVMLTIVFILTMITLSLLDYLRSRLLIRASARIDAEMSGEVLHALMSRAHIQGNLGNVMREFDVLRQAVTGAGVLALLDAPWIPIYLTVCFLLHPALGGLALAGAVSLLIVAVLNERGTSGPVRRANAAASEAYSSLDSSLASAGILRAMGMRRAMTARHMSERRLSLELQAQSSFTATRYVTLTKFLRLTLQSLALGMGAYLAIEQKISPGSIFAASLLLGRAMSPVEQIVGAWRSFGQMLGARKSLDDLFRASESHHTRTLLPTPTGALQVENVSLVTPARDRLILNDISFSLSPGECLGIVGPSGAGKSSLARVIAGAVAPTQGKIRIDGANLTDWDEDQLASAIGMLPQETSLFRGTIKENISRFSHYLALDPTVIDTAVIEAAKLVGAHDMILRMAAGYDTPLGANGAGLSAGQAQRIALARSVFGSPSLVVMDEPNSHLDAEGEGLLIEALSALKKAGITTIVVAHRTGILSDADKLLVLDDGRLRVFGSREEMQRRAIAAAAPAGKAPAAATAGGSYANAPYTVRSA
jgi:ATP-binding cassette subfamily C protein